MTEELTELLFTMTALASALQVTRSEHFSRVDYIRGGRKFGVHYFGFQICDLNALVSMDLLIERIKEAIWPDQALYPLIRRSKFSPEFKNINLWSANLGVPDDHGLRKAFEKFTEDLAGELKSVRIRFANIYCESHNGKIYVRLQPDSESQGVLRKLQSELIIRFSEFQKPGYVKVYDPSCRLLSLRSDILSANIEEKVRKCFEYSGHFEARLQPFIICHGRQVLFKYPASASSLLSTERHVPEWVTRSLFIGNVLDRHGTDLLEDIADLVGFKLECNTIESCDPKVGYYTPRNKNRFVAVFRSSSLRDSFISSVKRFMSDRERRTSASVIRPRAIYVCKALPAMEDELLGLARATCIRNLQDYLASVDGTTLALYLQQRDPPRWQYYFKTHEELFDLIALLQHGTGTEYLSSVW